MSFGFFPNEYILRFETQLEYKGIRCTDFHKELNNYEIISGNKFNVIVLSNQTIHVNMSFEKQAQSLTTIVVVNFYNTNIHNLYPKLIL